MNIDTNFLPLLFEKNDIYSFTEEDIFYLGHNKENILILIDYSDGDFLKSREYLLLLKIMEAVKLTLNEYAVYNFGESGDLSFQSLRKFFLPDKILFFDQKLSEKLLSKHSEPYKLSKFDNIDTLTSDALTDLEKDTNLKKLLWKGIKQLFA